eukprot:8074304-Alexandrium_andersonii.AAC.1
MEHNRTQLRRAWITPRTALNQCNDRFASALQPVRSGVEQVPASSWGAATSPLDPPALWLPPRRTPRNNDSDAPAARVGESG